MTAQVQTNIVEMLIRLQFFISFESVPGTFGKYYSSIKGLTNNENFIYCI